MRNRRIIDRMLVSIALCAFDPLVNGYIWYWWHADWMKWSRASSMLIPFVAVLLWRRVSGLAPPLIVLVSGLSYAVVEWRAKGERDVSENVFATIVFAVVTAIVSFALSRADAGVCVAQKHDGRSLAD